MTTTSVDDAIILPQSQGTGLSGEDSVIDAAINGVLNRYVGGEYVASEYSTGLQFQNHSGANDTVEVGPGIVFVQDNSSSTSGERGSGGNPQAESSTTSGYDTELPEGHTYAVLLPTATQISVSDSTLNEVYVDIDDVTANNSVNLEHDGGTTASPGNTSLKIGETNPDDASADTRANDDASPTYNSLTVNGTTDTDALNADGITRGLNKERKDASEFNGNDADTRLNNALSAASPDDVIYLEKTSYSSKTISKSITLIGTTQNMRDKTEIVQDWTIDASNVAIIGCNTSSKSIIINSKQVLIQNCIGDVSANANSCAILNCRATDVTFASGTSGGLADSLFGGSSVTDNGSNTVGDVR